MEGLRRRGGHPRDRDDGRAGRRDLLHPARAQAAADATGAACVDDPARVFEDGVPLHASEVNGLRMNEILDAMERSRASGAREAVALHEERQAS